MLTFIISTSIFIKTVITHSHFSLFLSSILCLFRLFFIYLQWVTFYPLTLCNDALHNHNLQFTKPPYESHRCSHQLRTKLPELFWINGAELAQTVSQHNQQHCSHFGTYSSMLNFFECIDLSENAIQTLGNFSCLHRVKTINASSNIIKMIHSLGTFLPNL